jgi:hypothetical protein
LGAGLTIHAHFYWRIDGLTLLVLRSKLIYHNEGFYPDEQVDAGIWTLNSTQHRFASFLERRLYASADAVIALSQKAKGVIEGLPAVQSRRTPVVVAPSCVDLDHFHRNPPSSPDSNDIRDWFMLAALGAVQLGRIARSPPSRRARETCTSNTHAIRAELVSAILEASGLSMTPVGNSVPYRRMPDELASQHVGLHFLPQGLSDYGGSPTKIGEYWAAVCRWSLRQMPEILMT